MNTLVYQDLGKTEKYIIGKYDIEIPVLPKILLYNIEIKQSSTTTITIPQPGLTTFLMKAPGYGSIYIKEKNKDLKWIYNLNNVVKNESIYIQPGSYSVIFRALNAKQALYTISKDFEVTSGSSKIIELY
jgi:Ca-activated chloride channel family protein